MSTYSVVLYLDNVKKRFSVTARKTVGARLNEVDIQQKGLGLTPQLISSGVTQAAANRLKRFTVATQKAAGHRQVPRPKL